jgi:hypothetical protein
MSTLGTLKAEIASDLDRTDLTAAIASAITSAISHYQRTRFYFNELTTVTFSTVDGRESYDVGDAAAIPYAVQIDQAQITVSGQIRVMARRNYLELAALYDTSASEGEPTNWSYYDQTVWLYPIPGAVYSVKLIGLFRVDAPASDGEAGNPWMTEAYELIRCRAKAYLGIHRTRDPELVQMMQMAEADALRRLVAETGLRNGTGMITPTQF